jgi:hypothetical protein
MNLMPDNSKNAIIFLGLCERAAYVRDGNTNLFKWNVLGLKNVILSSLFPLPLAGISIGIAFRPTDNIDTTKFSITDVSGKEIMTIGFATRVAIPEDVGELQKKNEPLIRCSNQGWTPAFLPLGTNNVVISQPGVYYVHSVTDQNTDLIGEIQFVLIEPPPLTSDRIAAVRSDPKASKAVILEIGCTKCPIKLKVYAALEQSTKLENDGCKWFSTIPDSFLCDCGTTKMDLSIIRRNLHSLLGHRIGHGSELSFIPLYEKGAIESIKTIFASLITNTHREEVLQQFIEENPILLHQFPATQIFSKPKILTFFAADFAIVTPQKELILIELEKTSTQLMKKDGGVAAPLSHAFDQVRDWLHVVDEHRLAVLDTLKIDRDAVSTIRGVVIAGTDHGYDAQHLRRLKGTDWGRITLLTYDDLFFALGALLNRMAAL